MRDSCGPIAGLHAAFGNRPTGRTRDVSGGSDDRGRRPQGPVGRRADGMTDFLTTKEVATLLRVKERKVYDLVSRGEIPYRKVTGRSEEHTSELQSH